MTAYDAARWSDFALAQLGASAALLGLVFVGISINLRDLVGSSQLVNRAGEAILVLGSVLLAATAVLIPAQDREVVGVELLLLGVGVLLVVARLQRHAGDVDVVVQGDRSGPPRVSIVLRRALGLGTGVLLVIGGFTLLADGGGGLYWWPPAIAAAYAGAVSNAWVLLVEILR